MPVNTVVELKGCKELCPDPFLERRMEVYLYFDVKDENVIFHMMGEMKETRHVILHNAQAVISPSWSIHTGVGTSNYTFIWGMCGENQEFDDMDNLSP